MNLVLLTLRDSLLQQSQSYTLCISSERTERIVCCFFPEYETVVSSAKIENLRAELEVGRSLMYIKKRRGPRTDPWGTPTPILRLDDFAPLMSTYWERPVRYDSRKVWNSPLNPRQVSLRRRIERSTLSKAFFRSRNRAPLSRPESQAL